MGRSEMGLEAAVGAREWIRENLPPVDRWPVPITDWILAYDEFPLTIDYLPPTTPRKLHGMTLPNDAGTQAVILINPNDPFVVQRFTLAHEWGHVLVNHLSFPPSEFDWLLEIEANTIAAELLLPWPLLKPLIPRQPLCTLDTWFPWWNQIGKAIIHQAQISSKVLYYHGRDCGWIGKQIAPP